MSRIIGIDPGTAITGFSILEKGERENHLIEYGCIRTASDLNLATRLNQIAQDLETIIQTFKPQYACVEELFFQKNVKTAISVAHARGVVIQKLTEHNIAVFELTPLQIKQAVCGYGQADKAMVQQMIKLTLRLKTTPQPDDAADAIAAALALADSLNLQKQLYV